MEIENKGVMTILKVRRPKNQKRVNWLPFIIVLMLFAAIVWIVYLFKDEKRFVVVKLYGEGTAMNLSKPYNLTQFSSGNISKGAVLAEEGDLMGIQNTLIYFKDLGHDSMKVDDKGDSLVFVNGKINSIAIFNNEELLPWFRKMNATTINELQTISFHSAIPGRYVPYLKEIARLKPNTDLVFEEDDSLGILDDYFRQADFFSPRFIKASVTQDKLNLLSRWKMAECLYLGLRDSLVTTLLPSMPSLKECIIYLDNLTSIDPSFFSNNTQLKKVTLIGRLEDYGFLKPLINLEELAINNLNNDLPTDLSKLKDIMGKLSVLIVSGPWSNINLLAANKNLRWLGMPGNTSQQQFNNITANLHSLQVLELQGSDSITSFASLQQLFNLRGLVITNTLTDKKSLYALKALRYLSVPGETAVDSANIIGLERALPGCILVPNSGACLGSGWLLLLVPVVLLLCVVFYKIQLKRDIQKTNSHEAC